MKALTLKSVITILGHEYMIPTPEALAAIQKGREACTKVDWEARIPLMPMSNPGDTWMFTLKTIVTSTQEESWVDIADDSGTVRERWQKSRRRHEVKSALSILCMLLALGLGWSIWQHLVTIGY